MKLLKPLSWLLTICVVSTLIAPQLQATPTPVNYSLTVEAGELRQSFGGFGASQSGTIGANLPGPTPVPDSNWGTIPSTPRNQMADTVYRDLKMNVVRLWVDTAGSNSVPYSVSKMLSEFNTNFVASGAIADIKARGVTTLLLAPAPIVGGEAPANAATYGNDIAELIYQIKNTYNIQIDVTGVANEPNPSSWTNAKMVDCVKYLRAGLDSRGMTSVKILAPETPSPSRAVPFVDALRGDATAWNGLFATASHSYGTVLEDDDMRLRKGTKQWWTTEASDGSRELAEDENRAATILARFLCEMNHGVDRWIFFKGLGQVNNSDPDTGSTAYMAVYDSATSSVVTFLKYYYFKQALSCLDVGASFRKCVSASEGEMFFNTSTQVNPAINAAAAYNPDGSWGISIVNDTGLTDRANSYPATYYNVNLNVEELANIPSVNFTLYRSSANNHVVNSGTVTLLNGQATIAISPRELVSLRSAATSNAIPPAPTELAASTINAATALRWNNTIKATSWKVKRALVSGGPYTTIATPTTTNYNDNTVVNGTAYYYVVSAVNSVGESSNSNQVVVSPAPFPWLNIDVGAVGLAGSLSVSDDATFTTKGSGTSLGGSVDSFNLTYKAMTGDGTMIARLAKTRNSTNSKAGIIMTETLGTSPKSVSVMYNFNGGHLRTMMNTRTTAGTGGAYAFGNVTSVPTWFKLVRSGNTFTGYGSADGVTWSAITSSTIAMGSTIYVGLANCSNNNSQLLTAAFDNVSVQAAPPTGLTEQASSGQIKLGWTASYGATSYNVKRATVSGGSYTTIGTATSANLSYTDSTVVSGTNYFYVVSAVNPMGESPNSAEFKAWQNSDVGTVGLAGNIAISDSGVFTTKGAGSTIGVNVDSFNFTHKGMTGDGTFIAKLTGANTTNATAAKIGIMMCETLGTAPKAACVFYDFNIGKASMYLRTSTGAYSGGFIASTITAVPVWLKLVRSGNTFTGYASPDGVSWTTISTGTITMGSTIYVGLVDCSRNTAQLCPASFDNVSGP